MFCIDAHLDLSMNAIDWNRDLTKSLAEIRGREQGQTDKADRAKNVVCLPEMRRGQIGLCVATQIARYVKPSNSIPGWYAPEIAYAQTQGQLAWYRAMEERGEMVQVVDLDGLEKCLALWLNNPPADAPIHYILSLEGADSILSPARLEKHYAQGLRACGPAHYGPGTYAQGTHWTGGIGVKGRELLTEMERLNIILDATHLCDESFWEALDHFKGHVWASHNNCRALVPNDRQFSDEQIKVLIERGAVIGAPLDAWMMVPNWIRNKSTPQEMGVTLEHMLGHMDHICQLAGNAKHVAIGTDLDGGFGMEQCPSDVQSIADLQRIPDMLKARGYSAADVEGVMYGNWVRFLRRAWAK